MQLLIMFITKLSDNYSDYLINCAVYKKSQKIVVIHFPTVDTKVNQPCRSRSVQALIWGQATPFLFQGNALATD